MFRTFVTSTAALLIYIASWILTVAGVLFNWLVAHTIVTFGDLYTDSVKGAVEAAWTAFRDIANVLIIGIFTYIAISIILDIKGFNDKKLIANVLIVAVLINFSLLFTKIAVDGSNFVAGQVYKAAALDGGSSATGTFNADPSTGSASVASAGIAGQFIKLLGVQTLPNTYSSLQNIAAAKDSGWIALLNGIFVFVILIAVALVLFYGSFLLVSRVILIIFLMITASLAFASKLIPKWEGSKYGWKVWLDTLFKTAAFAPILMLLLWATLSISYAIVGTGKTGSFGDILANPANGPDINTLVNYLIILGLLFLSFKLSSVFASKISGFNMAALVPALGAGILGRVAGFAGRQTLGRAGMYVGDKLQNKAKNSKGFTRQLYDFSSQRFNSLGKRDFNLMRTGFGGAVAKTAGTKVDTIAGKDLKGFEGTQKAFLKNTAEQARRLVLTDDEKKKIKEDGLDKTLRENADLAQRYAEAEKSQKESGELAKVLKTDREASATTLGNAVKEAEGEVDTHKAAVAAAPAGSPEHVDATSKLAEAERNLAKTRKEEKSQLREQDIRLKTAKEAAQRAGKAFVEASKEAEQTAKAVGNIPARAYKSAGDLAEEITKTSLTALLTRATAISKEGQEKLAKKAGKEAGKQEKQHHMEESGLLQGLEKLMKKDDHGHDEHEKKEEHAEEHEAAHPPAPPAAPAAPAATPPDTSGGHGGGPAH